MWLGSAKCLLSGQLICSSLTTLAIRAKPGSFNEVNTEFYAVNLSEVDDSFYGVDFNQLPNLNLFRSSNEYSPSLGLEAAAPAFPMRPAHSSTPRIPQPKVQVTADKRRTRDETQIGTLDWTPPPHSFSLTVQNQHPLTSMLLWLRLRQW